MPLTECPDCGRQVSTRAPTCPQCGAPIASEVAVAQAPVPADPCGGYWIKLTARLLRTLKLFAWSVIPMLLISGGFVLGTDAGFKGPVIGVAGLITEALVIAWYLGLFNKRRDRSDRKPSLRD